MKGGNRFSSSYSQYTLNSARLPSYLNLKVANKILFTGELLQLFQASHMSEAFGQSDEASRLDCTANTTATFMIRTLAEFDKPLSAEFNIMNEKLDSFSKEIYETSTQFFSIINFEALINKIRNHVSEV